MDIKPRRNKSDIQIEKWVTNGSWTVLILKVIDHKGIIPKSNIMATESPFVVSKIYPDFCFFESFPGLKNSQTQYFLLIYDNNNGQTIVQFLPFSWLKKPLER